MPGSREEEFTLGWDSSIRWAISTDSKSGFLGTKLCWPRDSMAREAQGSQRRGDWCAAGRPSCDRSWLECDDSGLPTPRQAAGLWRGQHRQKLWKSQLNASPLGHLPHDCYPAHPACPPQGESSSGPIAPSPSKYNFPGSSSKSLKLPQR